MNRQVGLLGGSFDPVHRAHLELARRARDQLDLDEIWWVPAHQPPHKTDRMLTPADHRVEMVRRAIAGERGFVLCTWEVDRPRVHATVDTVDALRRRHRDCNFHLLLGEDSFRALERWIEPQRLASLCDFVVLGRGPVADQPQRALGARVRWLTGERLPVSASEIRETLRRGDETEEVPADVMEYIRAHGLYAAESGS